MDESEAYVRWHTDAVAAQNPCADEVSSLVQAVRDHARTTRRLATVEAELKDAKERLVHFRELADEWSDWSSDDWDDQTLYRAHAEVVRRLAGPEGCA